MLEDNILHKLNSMSKPIVKTGDSWIMTTCLNPAHNDKKPSFAINLENGHGKCFSCGFKVSHSYWVDGLLDEDDIFEMERNIKYKKLMDFYHEEEAVGESATIFLPSKDEEVEDGWRGLKKETFDKYGIYICRRGYYKNRVIYPMYSQEKELLGFNTRALDNSNPKYLYSKGIAVNDIIYPPVEKGETYIVLVEGIMDALAMREYGVPAIFNFGAGFTFSDKKISELVKNGVTTIYLALDNDDAGNKCKNDYLESSLNEFFEIKEGKDLDELKDFYNSSAKDFSEYYEEVK